MLPCQWGRIIGRRTFLASVILRKSNKKHLSLTFQPKRRKSAHFNKIN
ncbi:hypothetical protein PTUN_a0037 [Pseudoalteromonas tunicata]|nr:hypothetical protein PTUN_a0037 [Pseudoalteromonas tunicata]